MLKNPSPRMTEFLRRSGSNDLAVAAPALHQLAQALTLPLRQGVLKGDIVTDIFEPTKFAPGTTVEFPLDFLNVNNVADFVAYTIPALGRLPERQVEGDFVMVPTYEVGSSIDIPTKYLRDARWDVIGRALQVLEASFIRKMNTDGWRVILAAAAGRNLVVYDDAVAPGLFSKRLVALMKTIMRRRAGGNSTSTNRGKMTRLYLSPESLEDVRSWNLTEVDDMTRREIFVSDEYGLTRIFGVELRDLDELGVGQEFETYFESDLSGTLPTYTLSGSQTKVEIVVGLDLVNDDSFMMPVRQEIELFEDPTMHRQRRVSMYGYGEHGFTCLSAYRALLGAV